MLWKTTKVVTRDSVFIAGGQPTVTYVGRKQTDVERELARAIAAPNQISSLAGPTRGDVLAGHLAAEASGTVCVLLQGRRDVCPRPLARRRTQIRHRVMAIARIAPEISPHTIITP